MWLSLGLIILAAYDFSAIKDLLASCNVPYIITLRSVDQGGKFAGSEVDRLELLQQLMLLKPPYIDVESDVAANFIADLVKLSPDTKIIRSIHNFNNTPEDLTAILTSLQHPNVSIYKIITTANTSLDALRVMAWAAKQSVRHKIVAHCMGADGIISRICGPVVGNYFIYASLPGEEMVVPNQVTIDALVDTYFIKDKT